MGSPARRSRIARRARGFAAFSRATRPSATTSSGPRMRKSIASPVPERSTSSPVQLGGPLHQRCTAPRPATPILPLREPTRRHASETPTTRRSDEAQPHARSARTHRGGDLCRSDRACARSPGSGARVSQASNRAANQVLEWNQIFIETLIATNTANSSSQRLGAIVHTAIFDAYNGIERRYTPIFVQNVDGNGERLVPRGASRRAAVIAAAYTALVGLFPSRAQQLSDELRGFARGAQRRWRRRRTLTWSAASPGAHTSRRPYSPGARPMASTRATRRSPEEQRSASGARSRPRPR